MKFRNLLTYSLLVLAPLALFWGCGKGSPSAPVSASSVAVTVPMRNSHGQVISSVPVTVLYYFSAGSGAPVTGVAGTVSASTGSSFSFDKALPSGTTYNYVAIQMNDYNNNVVALGAATITGSTAPVTLGPVNRAPYQVTLGAGQAYGFESNNKVSVGPMPTPTPGWGLDVLCNTTSTGFELDSLNGSGIAYMGNGVFFNFLQVPAASAFLATSTAAKAVTTTSTDVVPGDVFCVKLNSGGYAWLQASSVTGSGISFQYRVNTTLPYCGYEQTTADLTVFNSGNPTATATPITAAVTIAGGVTVSGSSPYDVAVWGPANGAATIIFIPNSSTETVGAYNVSNLNTALYQITSLSNPVGLVIDPNGPYLYIANSGMSVVNQYQISGSSFTLNGSVGAGQLASNPDTQAGNGALATPRYISLDNSGNLFITDTGTNNVANVMEFYGPVSIVGTTNVRSWNGSLSGTGGSSIGQVANASTTVIVANSANKSIDLYQADGTFIANYTSDNNPSGAVPFNNPQGVAWSASTNQLYISDTGNNRIVEMTLTGTFVKILDNTTLGANTLNGPTGIKLDGAQPPFIYVANTGNNAVLKLQ